MAYQKWDVPVEKGECVVELEHSYWSSRQIVRVNGSVMVDKIQFNNLENRYRFGWGEHELCVIFGRRWATVRVKYTLLVDGNVIEPSA